MKNSFLWITFSMLLFVHLLSIVILAYTDQNTTNRINRVNVQNQELRYQIQQLDIELAWQINYPKLDKWANENGFVDIPTKQIFIQTKDLRINDR